MQKSRRGKKWQTQILLKIRITSNDSVLGLLEYLLCKECWAGEHGHYPTPRPYPLPTIPPSCLPMFECSSTSLLYLCNIAAASAITDPELLNVHSWFFLVLTGTQSPSGLWLASSFSLERIRDSISDQLRKYHFRCDSYDQMGQLGGAIANLNWNHS